MNFKKPNIKMSDALYQDLAESCIKVIDKIGKEKVLELYKEKPVRAMWEIYHEVSFQKNNPDIHPSFGRDPKRRVLAYDENFREETDKLNDSHIESALKGIFKQIFPDVKLESGGSINNNFKDNMKKFFNHFASDGALIFGGNYFNSSSSVMESGGSAGNKLLEFRYGRTNAVSLFVNDTRVATAGGGGYDKKGTALGEWMQNEFQEELKKLYAGKKKESDYYGMNKSDTDGKIWLDGACGFNSMENILNAIGYGFERVGSSKSVDKYILVENKEKGGVSGKKEIFTVSATDSDNKDEGVDRMPITSTTYYSEDDAIEKAVKLKKEEPHLDVFINYGEYETPSGDIFGDINFTLPVDAKGIIKKSKGGEVDDDAIETVADLRRKNEEIGNHFFSPSTMKGFASKVESEILGGQYFITSEKNFNGTKREFTIRGFKPDGKVINNPFNQKFDTKSDAKAFLKSQTSSDKEKSESKVDFWISMFKPRDDEYRERTLTRLQEGVSSFETTQENEDKIEALEYLIENKISQEDDGDEMAKGGKAGIKYPTERLEVAEQSEGERQLELSIDNDGDLYRQRITPIRKNLMTKIAQGKFNINLAPKIYLYLIDEGQKKFMSGIDKDDDYDYGVPLTKAQKENLAKEYVNRFLDEASLGNYENDSYLPKKYQMEKGGRAEKTEDDYEEYLNDLYSQIFDADSAVDKFIYMTVPSRGNHLSEEEIQGHAYGNTLGTMLREYDPIAFNVGFGEWE